MPVIHYRWLPVGAPGFWAGWGLGAGGLHWGRVAGNVAESKCGGDLGLCRRFAS